MTDTELAPIVLTPEQHAKVKALVFASDGNYFGADTLTPQRAEIARLREELSQARDAITELTQENEILSEELSQARQALATWAGEA